MRAAQREREMLTNSTRKTREAGRKHGTIAGYPVRFSRVITRTSETCDGYAWRDGYGWDYIGTWDGIPDDVEIAKAIEDTGGTVDWRFA